MMAITLLLVGASVASAGFSLSDLVHSKHKQSHKAHHNKAHHNCTSRQQQAQTYKLRARFGEKWAHSACPTWSWFDELRETGFWEWRLNSYTAAPRERRLVMYDIGCNKGYTSAHLLSSFRRESRVSPATQFKAISKYIEEEKMKLDRPCGVCNDCGIGRRDLGKLSATSINEAVRTKPIPVSVRRALALSLALARSARTAASPLSTSALPPRRCTASSRRCRCTNCCSRRARGCARRRRRAPCATPRRPPARARAARRATAARTSGSRRAATSGSRRRRVT